MLGLKFFQRDKVSNSEETQRILGAITEGQKRTDAALKDVTREQGRIRTSMNENHEAFIRGISDVGERVSLLDQRVSGLDGKLDSHVIACEGPPSSKGRTAAKAGGLTGLGGTLALIGDWFYNRLNGG